MVHSLLEFLKLLVASLTALLTSLFKHAELVQLMCEAAGAFDLEFELLDLLVKLIIGYSFARL